MEPPWVAVRVCLWVTSGDSWAAPLVELAGPSAATWAGVLAAYLAVSRVGQWVVPLAGGLVGPWVDETAAGWVVYSVVWLVARSGY